MKYFFYFIIVGQSEATLTSIRIHKKHALDHTNAAFDSQFPLPSNIWNRYMFEEVELQDGEDLADCGVKCEIHKSQCDFFAHSSKSQMLQLIQKCYYGIYTQATGTVINVDEDIQTYHKTGKIFCH